MTFLIVRSGPGAMLPMMGVTDDGVEANRRFNQVLDSLEEGCRIDLYCLDDDSGYGVISPRRSAYKNHHLTVEV